MTLPAGLAPFPVGSGPIRQVKEEINPHRLHVFPCLLIVFVEVACATMVGMVGRFCPAPPVGATVGAPVGMVEVGTEEFTATVQGLTVTDFSLGQSSR
jgi:hypothetical protein